MKICIEKKNWNAILIKFTYIQHETLHEFYKSDKHSYTPPGIKTTMELKFFSEKFQNQLHIYLSLSFSHLHTLPQKLKNQLYSHLKMRCTAASITDAALRKFCACARAHGLTYARSRRILYFHSDPVSRRSLARFIPKRT